MATPTLPRLTPSPSQPFSKPVKRINDGEDLTFFHRSTAYRDLNLWLYQLNRSMFPTKDPSNPTSGTFTPSDLLSPPPFSPAVQGLRRMLEALGALIDHAPPSTGPRRFGNVAFREWTKLAEAAVREGDLIAKHLSSSLKLWFEGSEKAGSGLGEGLEDELAAYLLGSFGSAQRLDYGTGHELSFLAFLGCLWRLGVFADGEERAVVMGVVQPYLELMRKLILTYTLEPAGSHGVWGLDDHSFAPYIFGSAQLSPAISPSSLVPTEGSLPTSPSPSSVADKTQVRDLAASNMYFSAIQFIYDVKTGPFWEHSPVLYDVSGIKDGWGKINKGMMKMYAAEVLGKFPVVQHFPFGGMWKWEADAETSGTEGRSVHVQSQPVAPVSMDVAQPPSGSGGMSGVGTAAPWAMKAAASPASSSTSSTTMSGMQSSTGLPTTRAPWASTGGIVPPGRLPPSTAASGMMAPTAAPWATQRPGTGGSASTAAPWARPPAGR